MHPTRASSGMALAEVEAAAEPESLPGPPKRRQRPPRMRSVRRVSGWAWLALGIALLAGSNASLRAATRPNVLLIITDDQGYGDLGFHGNPVIRTPHLDRLARESARLGQFYSMPVCSPTRACLLTGRYNYRTGIVDTYLGRSMMDPNEVTLAEMLGAAGYRTGIFGKWHLGDNHPMRPTDQGFAEALVLRGGGLGQPSDVPGGGSYTDPILLRNGRPERTRGYVSDVITDAALEFVQRHRQRPWFAYLAFNAPHDPLEVPPGAYLDHYRDASFDKLPGPGHPYPAVDRDATAKTYAMIENIDDNVGRLLERIEALQLERSTIVVFLTDNGPQRRRYNAGFHAQKGTVYEGGIRVPCFIRWPGNLAPGHVVDRIASAIDLTPTLLGLCQVPRPTEVVLDGWNLAPLLRGSSVVWPDRTLFFQWHRGDVPQRYRAFAARSQQWKLVQPRQAGDGPWDGTPEYRLFDMAADPYETRDLAAEQPEVVRQLLSQYEGWFAAVTRGRDHTHPPRIALGTRAENPVQLTRQDWRVEAAQLRQAGAGTPGWRNRNVGTWEVDVRRAGAYEVTIEFPTEAAPAQVRLRIGDAEHTTALLGGTTTARFPAIRLSSGPTRVAAYAEPAGEPIGARYVTFRRR